MRPELKFGFQQLTVSGLIRRRRAGHQIARRETGCSTIY